MKKKKQKPVTNYLWPKDPNFDSDKHFWCFRGGGWRIYDRQVWMWRRRNLKRKAKQEQCGQQCDDHAVDVRDLLDRKQFS